METRNERAGMQPCHIRERRPPVLVVACTPYRNASNNEPRSLPFPSGVGASFTPRFHSATPTRAKWKREIRLPFPKGCAKQFPGLSTPFLSRRRSFRQPTLPAGGQGPRHLFSTRRAHPVPLRRHGRMMGFQKGQGFLIVRVFRQA